MILPLKKRHALARGLGDIPGLAVLLGELCVGK